MYRSILVPLDDSAASKRGLREAIRLASEQKARLRLIHVIDDFPMLMEMSSAFNFDELMRAARASGEDLLARGRKAATEAGVEVESAMREVTRGRIAQVVVDEAHKCGCDLIVMGTHGRRGISRLALGSDAELVVCESPVPVLLVRTETVEA